MSAFAAIVGEREPPPSVLDAIGASLTGVTGAPARVLRAGRCTLLQSALHARDAAAPVVHGDCCVAGTVMIEDRAALAAELQVSRSEPPQAIVAVAYGRWGEACTDRLAGEYAFALWDAKAEVLLCARDGFGVRLLYLAAAPGIVIATNVIAAALSHPEIPTDADPAALVRFLGGPDVIDPGSTVYRAIDVLPAGHTLRVPRPPQTPALRRHWWMPSPAVRPTVNAREATTGYRDVLQGAVADRIGSGPAAIMQSGGIDSATVASATAAVAGSGGLRAVTVEYRRFARTDEVSFAGLVSRALGIPHAVVAGDAFDPLDAEQHGRTPPEPLDEPGLSDWRAFVAATGEHATVALSGEDGDALFQPPLGGELLRNVPPLALGRAAARFALATGRLPALGVRRWLRGPRPRVRIALPWLTPDARRLAGNAPARGPFGLAPTPLPAHRTRSATQDRLSASTLRLFAAAIAPEATRARVEIALPLLDTRVVRYVFSMPPIPWCQHKQLARAAYAHVLPRAVCERPKIAIAGFHEASVAVWQQRPDTPQRRVPEPLLGWVDAGAWNAALRGGDWQQTMAAWRVLALGAWLASRGAGARCTA